MLDESLVLLVMASNQLVLRKEAILQIKVDTIDNNLYFCKMYLTLTELSQMIILSHISAQSRVYKTSNRILAHLFAKKYHGQVTTEQVIWGKQFIITL